MHKVCNNSFTKIINDKKLETNEVTQEMKHDDAKKSGMWRHDGTLPCHIWAILKYLNPSVSPNPAEY